MAESIVYTKWILIYPGKYSSGADDSRRISFVYVKPFVLTKDRLAFYCVLLVALYNFHFEITEVVCFWLKQKG